jgi:ABC-2 type transport system permease protein
MILTIARKEMIEMFRDGRFRVAGAIVFTLLAGALLLGWQHYREVAAQHSAAQKATREQWLGQGKKNPHSAAHYGVYAFKPKVPLSLVDHGTDPYTGVAVWLEAHKMNEFKFRPAQDATAVQRFGELTGATVLQLLIPLLIVLLTFQAFSGERESGTLRQLFSLGVKPADLAAGKALGTAAALGLLLVPAAAIGAGALALSSSNGELGASWARVALMALSYLLYFGTFTAISLAISAWAPSSRAALIALLGFWMLNGLIAPRAASDLAKGLHPTPSAFEFAQRMEVALKSGIDGHDPQDARDQRLLQQLLDKYKVTSVEALPVNFTAIRMQEGENHGNEVYDVLYGELWDTFDKQASIHRTAGVLAPGLALRSLSMGFAGTDFSQHAHFAKAAEEYRRMIQREMNGDLAKSPTNGSGPYLAGEDLWRKVPDFAYTAPDAAWVVSRQASGFAVLLGWFLVSVLLAIWSARRIAVW